MFKKIFEYRKNFFMIKSKELPPISKGILVIFFILSFFVLNEGVNKILSKKVSLTDRYGTSCIKVVEEDIKAPELFFLKEKDFGEFKDCQEIWNKLDYLQNEQNKVIREIKENQQEIKNYQEKAEAIPTDKDKYKKLIKGRKTSINGLIEHISNSDSIRELFDTIKKNKKTIIKNYEQDYQELPFYRFLNVFAFLFPTLLLFIYLSNRLKDIYGLLSFHVANVTGIILGFQLVVFIFKIIPRTVLKRLEAFLDLLNLGFLINIGEILVGIFIFGFIMKLAEKNELKKIFEKFKNSSKE